MTRHFLKEESQARYSQARFDVIRTIGRIAKDKQCQFIVVCGDVFESNQVDRKTVLRAMEALRDIPVPVYLLPGNHDPLNAASVYRSSMFIEKRPERVTVLDNSEVLRVSEEVELIAAPWASKRPARNPVEDALESIGPTEGTTRICIAHGAVDILSPDGASGNMITVSELKRVIEEGKIQFAALGDRHSLTKVDDNGRIWYSGSPEPTDFRETDSGCVNIVELDGENVGTDRIKVSRWEFIERERVDLNSADDVRALQESLHAIGDKECTVVRLNLVGTLSLTLAKELESHILDATDVFGAVDVRNDDLLVVPDDTDFADLGFSGFANATIQSLRNKIEEGDAEGELARDALMLMLRLGREPA